ncbi:hypothetical protein TgHK011_002769 [Trichoderma gracile]|nr:hypothetical protein TgHK011_002769 [Trichoderma gracile]
MKTRGRSVPATTSQSACTSRPGTTTTTTKPLTTAIIPSSSSCSSSISPIPINGGKLLSQADALARMTVELNVRAVSAQTERLEKGLGALVACTKEDRAFRETHDARLQSLCKEILAVKQRMEEIQGPEWNKGGDGRAEASRKEVDESIEQLRREMGEIRGLVSGISSALDRLPTVAEAEALMRRTQASASASNGGTTPAITAIEQTSKIKEPRSLKQRIEDTIASTRRWNRDHKTTKLTDAVFIANYLKQQSKRDPQMAVYMQRAIQKHVQNGGGGGPRTRARPKSLEQFCKVLVWKDVLDTAEIVLVRDWRRTARALEERA